ncbi:aggregation-promoting factor [Vagococcus elongatus]|uniref:LysM domain-containing protein n=1 Tax=Vagococcus elongatus TaxID=180344 RepID=A0A430B4I0_9ENTE|nr:LysM peptidoglycan-binding domain-containing protein [Vagococcus elongatus]RSU15213.1 hypothetical protein CBF29_02450 [Vagococcus elongatus]
MKLTKLFLGLSVAGVSLFFLGANSVSAAEVSHTVQSGETLSSISEKYYGDASHYITIANENKLSDVNYIVTGQILTFDTDNKEVDTALQNAAVAYAPVAEQAAPAAPAAPAAEASYTGNASSAKEWIAMRESGGSYSATNGRYIGRYQLDSSYLNGDYSESNQERVADSYVAGRYGSWENAQQFWLANGWY